MTFVIVSLFFYWVAFSFGLMIGRCLWYQKRDSKGRFKKKK